MSTESTFGTKRKIDRGPMAPGHPVYRGLDGVWQVQDYATARIVLRSTDTRQAGFGIEKYIDSMPKKMRRPVLYRDGFEHREHRRQTAKYFTPRRVDTKYRDLMHRLADEQCTRLAKSGRADLSDLSFALAVAVAAEVIGIDGSRTTMARRLERFFTEHDVEPGWRSLKAIHRLFYNHGSVLSFFLFNVWPSVRARRKWSRDDLISHLLEEGCTAGEVLGECVTFGAAGMITTREFITVAAWHLFTDDDLRSAYRVGDEPTRYAILHEILRLEPIVADLFRYTTVDMELTGSDGPVTIPAGAKVNLRIATANLDPAAVGDNPTQVCPTRPVADKVGDAGLAFGEGAHRCPGASIAIQEADIFLTTLFALPGLRMVQEPTVRIRPEIASYELVGLQVAVG